MALEQATAESAGSTLRHRDGAETSYADIDVVSTLIRIAGTATSRRQQEKGAYTDVRTTWPLLVMGPGLWLPEPVAETTRGSIRLTDRYRAPLAGNAGRMHT